MNSVSDFYTLTNGVRVPCIGLGTWQVQDGATAVDTVAAALAAGYRHIDTAAMYANEGSVGLGMLRSGLKREEIFLTSKLQNTMHGYQNTRRAFEQSLNELQTDYLDLYLIHWPNPALFRTWWKEANAESWKAFEEFYREGKVRAIGVSNFREHHIDALMETASVAPMVNQLRLCPGSVDNGLAGYCRKAGMLLEAYSPLGTGRIFGVQEIVEIARKVGRSVAQVCIRWSLQMGFLPLPKSTSAERIAENARVFDFELSPGDVQAIASLRGVVGYPRDPDTIDF